MTFSQHVKQELVRLRPEKNCCALSELSALTQACGSLVLRGGGKMQVRYNVESAALAKLIFMLLKSRLLITPVVHYHNSPRFGGRRVLVLTVQEADARRLLLSLNMLKSGQEGDVFRGVPRSALKRRCCRQAFLRGAFLGAGAMQGPEYAYHMAFAAASLERAQVLSDVMYKSGVIAALSKRRGAYLVYVKSGDKVADLLALMGANQSLLALENMRITRQMRAQANRASNCDAANMEKQLSAAQRQADVIKEYSLRHSLSGFSPALQEVARKRMLNPDVSLEQLGAMFEPPISKSSVNHRLRRLMEMINNSEEGK